MPENFGGTVGTLQGKLVFNYTYDFAVLGGAISTITLPGSALPNNFIIQNAFIDILTILASGGAATAALSTGQGAGDLVAATAFSGAPWSTTGPKVTIPLLGTIATWIKLTALRQPTITIAAATLTGGKFNLFFEGYISS
jgi:hypothetical protein